MSDIPWSPRTPQQSGDQTEKQIVKKHGGRVHPRSGAGRIKDDGSSADFLFEIKECLHSHTLNGRPLLDIFRRAVQQGKEARYIIYFKHVDLTADITLRRGKG